MTRSTRYTVAQLRRLAIRDQIAEVRWRRKYRVGYDTGKAERELRWLLKDRHGFPLDAYGYPEFPE